MKRVPLDDLETDGERMFLADQPFTGVGIESKNDVLVEEIQYEDGLKNGRARVWFPNGVLKTEEHYWRDSRHGVCSQWDDAGRLRARETYEFSILVRREEPGADGGLRVVRELPSDAPQFKTLELLRAKFAEKVDPAPGT